MLTGVDFDNTIVCYDELFHRVAREQGLIPPSVPATKGEVRRYLEGRGLGDAWTELQGYVYGARMGEAPPFPGVLEFFRRGVQSGLSLAIISHKSRYPARGPRYDLHEAARRWLEGHGFSDPGRTGLPAVRVYFELSQHEKLVRIAREGCAWFIDDLPELLTRPDFPSGVRRRILFDPHGHHAVEEGLCHTTSWAEIERLIQCSKLAS
jgi:hypothetical protein